MKIMKKRVLAAILCAACAATLAVPAFAEDAAYAISEGETPEEQEISVPADPSADTALLTNTEAAEEAYALSIKETEHGTVSFYEEDAEIMEKEFVPGDPVILSVIPDEGYAVQKVVITHEDVTEECVIRKDGLYESRMPGCAAEIEAVFIEAENLPDETENAAGEQEMASGEADLSGSETKADAEQTEDAVPVGSGEETSETAASSGENEKTKEEISEAEKDETKEEPEEETEEKAGEPAASTRLLVKTEDPSLLDEEAVIGVMDDVYLLQFDSKEEAGDALASYEENAEFVSADLTVCAADYGGFATGDPNAEIVMTETDNPFSDTETAAPVAASRPLIALIDTGVSGTKEVSGRYSVLGDDGFDGNGHGSAMLDTIRGYDPKAEVVSIKALDDAGMGTISSLYAAIRMAIDMQVSVINLSLSAYSTEENEAVASIIREAASAGITVVGAAGNNGSDTASYIPANIPEAVITAACNKEGARLPSSNYGGTVDLFILAGSSSYAAATLSGIISATGGVPGPDGMAVYAPSGAVAADDYVDGLCYDGMSGNFQAAGVTYTIHNAGGRRLTDLIPGLTYDTLRSWLGSHENDDYYLGTPYPEQIVNGVPQYILGRSGDCDNRNPNGDCGEIHGNDDYAGVAMMNCTGFVWHALWKASGLSYTDGINRIPAWGGIGAGSWKNFIQNNGLEYMTVKSGGTGEINDMLSTAMWSAKDADGNLFMEKGDIIWFWVDQIPLGGDDLPVNGYFGGLSDKAHVGIYWPKDDGSDDNRWWDSIGICEYQGEGGVYLRNMLHQFTPKTGSVAMTVIKLGRDSKPKLTKVNVQKTSANPAMTDGNSCYSLKGAKYAVYKNQSNAAAMTDPVTTFTTDETGYGESEEVLEIDKIYYLRETEPPEGGSFLLDPTIHAVKTKEADQVTRESATQVPETPANDPAYLSIEKVTSDGIPVKEAKPLSGTQFTIRYYKGEYTKLSNLPDAAKTWVIETKKQSDGAYRAYLLPDYKASGDDFYFLSNNPDPILPLGTVTIEETKAAEGYRLENNYKNGSTSGSGVYLAVIRKSGDAVHLTYGNTAIAEDGFTASDTPVKGGVKIQKLDGDMKLDYDGTPYAEGDKSLFDAEFTIYNKSAYAVKNKDGNIIVKDGAVQVIKTDAMGVAKTGNADLPYGTYEIKETKASTGYKVNTSWVKSFAIREDGKIVELTSEADACYEPDIKGGVKIQKLDEDIKLEMDGKPYAEGDKNLSGAEFTIFNKSAHAVKNKDGKIIENGGAVQVIKTDANGVAATGDHDLPYGTYEIKETKHSEGYKLNSEWKKSFTVRKDGEVTEFTSEADACFEPDIKGGVQVQKLDRELGKAEAIGAASLGGITYQIINSSKHAAKNKDGVIIETGAVMQEITTDKTGLAKTGESDLPYGTYTLHEITVDDLELSANDNYLNKGAEDVIFTIREDKKIVTIDKDGKDIIFSNQVRRNDLEFRKVEAGSDKPMGSIPFVIEAAATGEKHVIVTDANGIYSSTKYAHSRDTNANDGLLDGYTEETVIKDADLIYKTGTWFGLGQEETMAKVDDALPAFPYGKYIITELRCEANEGYELIKNYPFVIEEDTSETGGEKLSLNNLHNIPILPEIKTMALSDKTNDHILCAEEDVGITDLVSCKNLLKGRNYILSATLMDEETENAVRIPGEDGARIKVTGETAFTSDQGTMSVPVPILLDARTLAGKKLVVFEQLFLVDEDGGKTPVADHKEIADEDQTITIPEAKTTFRDTESGSQIGQPATEQKVEDTVQYTGLIPGKEYTVTATVKTEDENGEAIDLKDADGNIFTKTQTFTPEKSDGSVKVEFVLDSSLLAGKKAVCFEEIRYGEVSVAIHADINDEDQTIWYPLIRTTATDQTTGEHVAAVSKDAVFNDVVFYSGLKPGETYTAKAVLMDAESGEPIKQDGKEVTAEAVFTPKDAAGEVSVEIPVNTEVISGKKTVVFEELYIRTEKDGKETREKIAEHKDLTDEGQQVSIPEIRTTLTDDRTDSHSASFGEKTALTDTVSYKSLIPGKEYRLEATLMTVSGSGAETEVKDADGNPVKAEKTFTAKAAEGEETVTFTVNTALLAGKKVVAFETLYLDKIKLAVHADIKDEDQTVAVPAIRTNAWDAVTGKQLTTEGSTVIVDTITYTNLTPGASYRVKGSLMDAGTGKPISAGFLKKVTGEVEFKPEAADGTVDVSFAVSTEKLSGVTAVVFEELYLVRDGKEIPAAEHKDLSDTDQQVKIPEVKTTASVKGEKECVAGEDTELVDTVSYKNLVLNENYVLKGKLIDKESGQPISVNGKPITAEKAFTAVSGTGTEEMTFVFDSTLLAKKTVVVFEDLYITNSEGKEVKVASHADVKDAEQSVKIIGPEDEKKPTPTPLTPKSVTPVPGRTSVSAPRTGDNSHWKLYVLLLGGAAAAGIGLFIAKKRKNKNA